MRATSYFPWRYEHSSVVLKNSAGIDEIYVIGGLRTGVYLDDVWKSDNGGRAWTQVITTGTKFSARYEHSSVVIGSNIYVIAGSDGTKLLDDIWKSVDKGLTWKQVETTGTSIKFSARSGHSSVVLKNSAGVDEMYVIGGYDGTKRLDDVWKSADGITWTQVAKTKFSGREGHSSVVLGSEIYVIAGRDGATNRLNDVWKSANGGLAWTEVEVTTKFPTRSNHSSIVIDNEIYVIAGYGGTYRDDIRKSADKGLTWTEVETTGTSTKFPARYGHSSVVRGVDIYVIGGTTDLSFLNDVWKSTDGKEWTLTTSTVDPTLFSVRSQHSSVVRKNKSGIDEIYVIGGYDGTKRLDDVWKSADGITWTEVATATKFPARDSHSSVVNGSEIYVIGGFGGGNIYFDDVWKSADGITWKQVAATKFSVRRDHSSVVKGSEIYVIAGFGGGNIYFDDVWKSTDGITWKQVTTVTKFSARAGHSSVVLKNSAGVDEMYVIGGLGGTKGLNDVWKSADGITWTQIATTKFPARYSHSSAVIAGTMFVIGGYENDDNVLNDVWKSRDGVSWTQLTQNAQFVIRAEYSTVVFRGRVFVIGGFSDVYYNDVWVSR